jgi:hypothetical protein
LTRRTCMAVAFIRVRCVPNATHCALGSRIGIQVGPPSRAPHTDELAHTCIPAWIAHDTWCLGVCIVVHFPSCTGCTAHRALGGKCSRCARGAIIRRVAIEVCAPGGAPLALYCPDCGGCAALCTLRARCRGAAIQIRISWSTLGAHCINRAAAAAGVGRPCATLHHYGSLRAAAVARGGWVPIVIDVPSGTRITCQRSRRCVEACAARLARCAAIPIQISLTSLARVTRYLGGARVGTHIARDTLCRRIGIGISIAGQTCRTSSRSCWCIEPGKAACARCRRVSVSIHFPGNAHTAHRRLHRCECANCTRYTRCVR